MSREYTNKLIELCEEGILTYESVFNEFMCYLSEDDVKGFCLDGFAGEISEQFKELEED